MTLVCFSHLRWSFVFQRPQQLMTRFARKTPIIYWEEPICDKPGTSPRLETYSPQANITVAVPRIPEGLSAESTNDVLRDLLHSHLAAASHPVISWYYTPMMLPFSRDLDVACTIYDCMDELANFRFAPHDLLDREIELLGAADLVFTGGYSLFEAKRARHPAVHPFPSSVDARHFEQARIRRQTAENTGATQPRLGFYGVIDERMDLGLLAAIADAHPEWQLEIVGPVVKIAPSDLPERPNLLYTGAKTYDELPSCAARWDVALMPFAINDATRFISPTKTPEYLAAGLPVVSTPITDVERHYGGLAAVEIAGSDEEFIAACERALARSRDARDLAWLHEADAALAGQSWQAVAAAMWEMVQGVVSPVKARKDHYDYLVVGAGFAGAVMAERLAEGSGKRVLVIDKRDHIGGNAYDHYDDAGILVHRYGPHIFHTNSQDVVEYLSRFTRWRPYEHRVLADIDGLRVPMPINRTTLNKLYGLELDSEAAAAEFLASRAEPVDPVRTSEDVVISKVGRELYRTFFRGYTRKQWGMDPSELDKSVTARVPTRTDTDDRYFTDRFQAMPAAGFTKMFAAMLDHPLIDVELGVTFADVRERISYDRLVFTGPIDEYFNYRYGRLPYRSLDFHHASLDQEWFQPTAVVNFPDEQVPYTRVTEYKHLTGQVAPGTSITYEYPSAVGDPYYPIPREENRELFKRYEALAASSPDVLFVGRLATYRYYNMDQVVAQALATYRRHEASLAQADAADERFAVAAE